MRLALSCNQRNQTTAMDSVRVTHVIFSLVFPSFVLLFSLLCLPLLLIYRLLHVLLPASNENMAGKVVLITGASSGIGEQLAYQYAKTGASLVLAARREKALEAVAENSKRLGSPQVLVIPTDVSKAEECKQMVEKTITHFGQLNHLVTNAGVGFSSLFQEVTDITRSTRLMDVNFWGMVYPTYYAIPHLIESRGNIVVMSSMGGQIPIPRMSIYSASKAALIKFFEVLRAELGSAVKITIVTPGYVESEMTSGKLMLKDGDVAVNEEARDILIGPLPTGGGEACAKAIVDGARRGERYVTWPAWYRAISLLMFLIPERVDWFFHYFFVGDSRALRKNALSKRILDKIGTDKFYPPSIRSSARKSD